MDLFGFFEPQSVVESQIERIAALEIAITRLGIGLGE